MSPLIKSSRFIISLTLITGLFLSVIFLSCGKSSNDNGTVKAKAKNVIVVVIDGLRNDEAFDDPTHQYIPYIWNDLRPLGTINTNFWNTGITVTTAAHTQIVTGVRSPLNNQATDTSNLKAKYPNIFEYYRGQKDIEANKVWFIAGKGTITKSIHSSLHPDYYNLGASSDSNKKRSDDDTWEIVQEEMDAYQPSLMVINLADVDSTGHKGVYSDYTDAIKNADQIVYELWQKIQLDPNYRDKTDLIITTDHGRHSDDYLTGFQDHGDRNHGNRHIMFLAIGPDFKEDEVVEIRRDQIDIVPTIGAILGIQTPYADGNVMTELFNDPVLGQNIITGGQRRVSLSACSTGVHAVWSEKNGQEWDIYYKRSKDNGNTWTETVKLFESDKDNNYFYEAVITSQDNGLVYAAAIGYSLTDIGGETYTWKVFGKRSLDGGNTWKEIQELEDVGVLVNNPVITSGESGILITFSSVQNPYKNYSLQSLYSSDSGATFSDYQISDRKKDTTFFYPSIAAGQNKFYTAWTNERASSDYTYWNVFFDSSHASSLEWGTDKAITSNTDDKTTYFMNNSITVNNSDYIKLATTMRNGTGKWKVLLKSSSDSGNTFSDEEDFYDSNTYSAWNPKVSFTNPGSRDFIIVWEQHYGNGNAEIYYRKSVSSEWKSITLLSLKDELNSAEPDLTVYNGNIYAGWQDYESNNWQIKIKKIDFPSGKHHNLNEF